MSDQLKIYETRGGVDVRFGALDPAEQGALPFEDMRHIRIIGCADMRQCEVKYDAGTLFFRERNKPDSFAAVVELDQLFRRIFVAIIKANDGMEPAAALKHGLKALPGFEYLTVAEEVAE